MSAGVDGGLVVPGVEIAVGYVCAWLVGKARRVAGRADAEIDRGLDAGMDRLHGLVSAKLGTDPALERAREEADAGEGEREPSERTRQRLILALEEAAETDHDFTAALAQALAAVQAAGPVDVAFATGTAKATNGAAASTGVVRPGGTGSGSATAEHTGDATADGTNSKASTGVDYS
ncbi:hypothetical protein [Streptomyces aureus]|uniref:hypothetical protein n=1 Tax=Streptomyces aureus TaxID=193461 RepID=UPI00069059EF|nr:hypothetical protein [Streptomyces aureus]